MLALLLFVSAEGFLRHVKHLQMSAKVNETVKLDPHCSKGIMNTEMTACCQADCGECSDTSDLCDAARQDEKNPHGRESTCCPATMLAGDLPSCENSMAPCAVPESVRNPPDLTSITAADVHAKDDCGEVQKATKDSQHLHTAFLKFQGKEFTTKTEHGGCLTTSDCGSYGTLEQAAAACSNNDDCLAFDTDSEGKPDCLIMAEEKIMTLTSGSNDVYIKREFHFTGEIFGLRSVSHDCFRKNPAGALKVKLGFCTSQIAMNELDGAEVYTDLPRAACAPTPSPTPAPTTTTTTTTFAGTTSTPYGDYYYGDYYYGGYYYGSVSANCPADFDPQACYDSVSPDPFYYWDYSYAVSWPGDGWCDDFLEASSACANDCGDCPR